MEEAELKTRLTDAKRNGGKLNLAYVDFGELTPALVAQIKAVVPGVHELDLRHCALSGLPDELLELKQLKTLKLNYNRLTAVPPVLVQLPRLATLELSGNQIASMDDWLGTFPALKELDLSGNQLAELPGEIVRLHTLTNINLENNMLTELPANMGDMRALQRLDVSTNRLTQLPSSLGKCTTLQRIDVSANSLTTIPPSLGHLKQLRELDCKYNELKEPLKSRSEEGLFKFLAFLCEEEERLRLEEIERLKPVGTAAGNWLEFRMKVDLEGVTDGGPRDPEDRKCYLRNGASITFGNNHLWIFGGTLAYDQRKVNDLFYVNMDRMEWQRPDCTGDIPPACDGHCAFFDEEGGRLIVFGGHSADKKRLVCMYALDVATMTWSKLLADGAPPAAREHHVATVTGHTAIVFGGRGSGLRFNDVHLFDMSTNTWSNPPVSGSAPSPRQESALCVMNNKLWVHGGRNDFVLDDLYNLDLSTFVWTEVPTAGRLPASRYGHSIAGVDGHVLYVALGRDELGGAYNDLYRLSMEQPSQGAAVQRTVSTSAQRRPEWVEYDSQLMFNESRLGTFVDGELMCFQVGSKTLGIAEGGGDPSETFWSVFKQATITDSEEKILDAEALKPINAKKLRVNHVKTTKKKDMKASFRGLSPKEALMLEYVENFRLQFVELYPKRRPLLLVKQNECGVQKFVCTTVRPSQLQYTELYDCDSCCRFVADFLKFEQLEDPLQYPETVTSPYTVLGWQAGDSFDFALTLVSLLTGVGYAAYVVVGYAPKAVTSNDVSAEQCPVLVREKVEADTVAAAVDEDKAKVAEEEKPPKYPLKEPMKLESQFEKSQAAKEAAAKAAAAAEEAEAAKAAAMADAVEEDGGVDPELAALELDEECGPDPIAGRRIHAWVLVLAGKRQVPENFFIEPTTGAKHSTEEAPYLGIEFVWNHINFWVNMQEGKFLSTPDETPVKGVNWDLSNPTSWEAVLDVIPDAELVPEVAAPVPGEEGESPKKGEAGPESASALEGMPVQTMVDMPPSWVPKLNIPREIFDMRCPRGAKLMQYDKCNHEIFAMFGECARWDGMVDRLQVFEDSAKTILLECRESYMRRKDKLRQRVIRPLENSVVERFDPGSSYGIKEMHTKAGEQRVTDFYSSARLDGLVTRTEYFSKKTIEVFEDRDDGLVYRSVAYDPLPPQQPEPAPPPGQRVRRTKKKKEEPLQPIRKMTEKFAPKETTEDTISKRTFYVVQDQIRLDYHFAKGRITASRRHYTKDGAKQVVMVDPLAPQPREQDLFEEYQRLLVMEKECSNTIREVEKEIKAMLTTRTKEEQNINLITPYYDVIRVNAEHSDDEGEGDDEKVEHDYLSPFLPTVIGNRKLTKAEAMEVREKCLKALKDRLIERANIIQARHDEETAALAKRQANFLRDRDKMTAQEEEEYENACEESMFRIHILEQRLKRHEEQALAKYYSLDTKLRSEERLAALVSSHP